MKVKVAVIAAALMLLCAAIVGPVTGAVENTDDKIIHVSGVGKVTTTPDRAIISLAVETENADVKVAQQENAVKMDKSINALKALGPDIELKTTGYKIYPKSINPESKLPWDQQKKVYQVTNTLLVTVKNVDLAGSVIDTAIKNGANRLNYISFTLSDEKEHELRSQALTAAVKQARFDADAVAGALSVEIIGVKDVNVGGSYTPLRYADNVFMEKAAVGGAVPTPIEPDTVDVTATVSIDYLIA